MKQKSCNFLLLDINNWQMSSIIQKGPLSRINSASTALQLWRVVDYYFIALKKKYKAEIEFIITINSVKWRCESCCLSWIIINNHKKHNTTSASASCAHQYTYVTATASSVQASMAYAIVIAITVKIPEAMLWHLWYGSLSIKCLHFE